MKRKLQNILILSFVMLGFFACNDDDNEYATLEPAAKTVRITQSQDFDQISENSSDIIKIGVYINYENEQPVKVNYEITGNTDAVEEISVQKGVTIIPAGEKTGVILLKAVDNIVYNRPFNEIKIKLTGVNQGYGLPVDLPVEFGEKTIQFIDDECSPTLPRNNFVGDLDAVEIYQGTVYQRSAVGRPGSGCNTVDIEGDIAFTGMNAPILEFYLDPDSDAVICEKQFYMDGYTYEATGVYNEEEIFVTYDLDGPSGYGGDLTISRQ